MGTVLQSARRSRRLVRDGLQVHDLELRVPDVSVAVEDLPALALLPFRRQRDVQQLPAVKFRPLYRVKNIFIHKGSFTLAAFDAAGWGRRLH